MTPWRSSKTPYSIGWWAGYDGRHACPLSGDVKAFEIGKAAREREMHALNHMTLDEHLCLGRLTKGV